MRTRSSSAVQQHEPDILALSALLTTVTPEFQTVLESLGDAGLREHVKIMVGGASASVEMAGQIGADGYARDCVAAVGEAERLLGDRPLRSS